MEEQTLEEHGCVLMCVFVASLDQNWPSRNVFVGGCDVDMVDMVVVAGGMFHSFLSPLYKETEGEQMRG